MEEGPKLDFKREPPWDLQTREGMAAFVKCVSAIANAPGKEVGYIILGISDTDRTLVGIDPHLLEEETLQHLVAAYADPPFKLSYVVRPLHQHYLGVIAIPPSKQKPHLINKTIHTLHEGTCYTRRGSTTALAKSADIREMVEAVSSLGPGERVDAPEAGVWSRADLAQLDPLALAILNCFIEQDSTELSLEEIKDHCLHRLQGRKEPGRVLAGKLKLFYSRRDKDRLVEKNPQTNRWRFDERYRSVAEEVLQERGFI
jgi:hypothetical protein